MAKLGPEFLQHVLSHSRFKSEIEEAALGITMFKLNQGIVEGLTVPCPPVADQQPFALAIAGSDGARQRAQASLAHLDALFASLQSRAFRGEL